MPAPRLVIFDCDGVLIDSEVIACRADAACFAEIGLAISVEEVMDRYVGISTEEMLADIAARHGRPLPADLPQRLRARVAAAFEAELEPLPDVLAAIDAVPGLRCVASGSGHERLRHALTLVGLFERFDPHIFSAAQVAQGKPAPDLFLFAARAMGAEPRECVVVEDSVAGVEAGVAAGMRVLGFVGASHCRPGHGARLRAAGAAHVFGHMRELPALVSR